MFVYVITERGNHFELERTCGQLDDRCVLVWIINQTVVVIQTCGSVCSSFCSVFLWVVLTFIMRCFQVAVWSHAIVSLLH